MKNNDLVQVIEDSEEFYKLVSNNVKKFRKKFNYTQLDFSENIGFNSVSFYCDCENNKNGKHFNLLHIVRIAKFLNIDINELINL
jgi:DNA-binding XRE family transcriptional regulator